MGAVLALLILIGLVGGAIVIGVRAARRRGTDQQPSDGNDVVAYLVMALAMIVTGFAFAGLATTAFSSSGIVIDPASELASSLPALIVAGPLAGYFWIRQAKRRALYPNSVGWGVYLALIQLVLGVAFVISAVIMFDGLFGDSRFEWTSALVFGGLMFFHELAARQHPPATEAGELYRVIGSAIGLVTMTIGLVMTLGLGVFGVVSDAMSDGGVEVSWMPWVAMIIVGAPLWVYYWMRQWPERPGLPRTAWTVIASVAALGMTVAGITGIVSVLADTVLDGQALGRPAETLPVLLSIAIVGAAIWLVHRRDLSGPRSNPLRAYEYATAALSLWTATVSLIALVNVAFGDRTLVGGNSAEVAAIAISLLAAIVIWLWFSTRWSSGDRAEETGAWPRKLYLLGVGVIAGIASAIALIVTLVVVVNRLVDGDDSGSLLIPVTTFVVTGVIAWYLLTVYQGEQTESETSEDVAPFNVMVICAHPGPLGAMFHPKARVQVIHRGDGSGVISEEMATDIVEAVGYESSVVWVDEDGYRVAPLRV